MAKARPAESSIDRLAAWFADHGCEHSAPDPALRKSRKEKYKRGYEVRLSVDPGELAEFTRLLIRADFKPGKPFPKSQRVVVPLYGKEQVHRFLSRVRGKIEGDEGKSSRKGKS